MEIKAERGVLFGFVFIKMAGGQGLEMTENIARFTKKL